jgi:hypothetical protein
MRKQNDSIPPTLKPDSRLIDSVIRSAKYKRPNALKHGVYATPALIPGENRKEFEELLAELLDEYKPLGPSLRHAVHCLAESMWRLRRLKKSVQTELYVNTFDPHHPAFNEMWGFTMFLSRLRAEPETCFNQYAKKCLRPDKIDDLEQKFPRTDYQSTAEWAKAISFQIYCRPSPNSRRLSWVTEPTSWSRQRANGEPTYKWQAPSPTRANFSNMNLKKPSASTR